MWVRRATGVLVLGTAWATGCGGESQRIEGTGATGGSSASGGKGGRGGTGGSTGGNTSVGGTSPTGASGGTGGSSTSGRAGAAQGGSAASCPIDAPQYVTKCPDGLPDQGCAYTYECPQGPIDVTAECNQFGTWTLAPASCKEGDFCNPPNASQLHCSGGKWTLGQGGEQQSCPEVRTLPGATCPIGNVNYVSCGYACTNGSWTVGRCIVAAQTAYWSFEPTCPEDHPNGGVGGESGAPEGGAGEGPTSNSGGGEGPHSGAG